ncbi:hypothetical protein J7E88_07105 [Streptomyces sp. ISL-10]|uniref:hypothetical protein n=1 Tax=Streptomyces sp. ISL-10 TaxID=2819172 RepID=UPI001BEC25EA|nr:hypothetical protein [Streptomyces sp. ISL-10]MBT2365092.1 hypothetical protein [Streptomyces sp. ISL-10]
MAWDEWEQLKAEATQRQSAQMQLNQYPADGGGPGASDRLKSDKKAWVKAGEGTKRLEEPIGTALTKLEDGQAGLGESAGCQSVAAQKELYDSWNKYVKDVRERCKSLGGLLESSGHDLSKTDGSLKSELDAIKAKYKDTEAVGGQAKGQ